MGLKLKMGLKMSSRMKWSSFALVLGTTLPLALSAQQGSPTSRTIFFNGIQTTLPPSGTQDLKVQLWDDPSAGNLLFTETQPGIADDANSTVGLVFGSQTAGGLDPSLFPTGSSRYVDVTDAAGTSVLAGGRLQLTATPFALNPGPQGPPGVVEAVTAGDGSVTVGGTIASPTVAVAPNGITNAQVANAALSPVKISGTAATLGANTFTGRQTINDALVLAAPTRSFFLTNTGERFAIAASDSFQTRLKIDAQGNVGINQDSPRAKLEVLNTDASGTGVLGASTGALAIGVSGTNATASGIGVYGANTGGGFAGLFDGKLLVNGALTANTISGGTISGAINASNGTFSGPLTVTSAQPSTINGSLSIGAGGPSSAKLVVNDTSIGTGVAGYSTFGSGVFGQTENASGFGVFGDAPFGGYAVYANGNTGQNRANGGWVKAMIFVTEDGVIGRCFNSFLTGSAASSPPCGFTVDHLGVGAYNVGFGFQIGDRFYSIAPKIDSSSNTVGAMWNTATSTTTFLQINLFSAPRSYTNAPFMLIVY